MPERPPRRQIRASADLPFEVQASIQPIALSTDRAPVWLRRRPSIHSVPERLRISRGAFSTGLGDLFEGQPHSPQHIDGG